jgi:FkbM family methyltransferase
VVERLVANEKVEGSNPFARSIKIIVKKKNLATNFFQEYIEEKDIRKFKNNIFYYLYYRISRLFFNTPLKVKIYDFNLFSSNKKNNTSYSLLQKCNFFDIAEIKVIKKINKLNPIFFVDCGCNFGFYSFFTASLSEKNEVIAIEASKKTLEEFKENLLINNFKNIKIINKAVFHINNKDIEFNISNKDWESSLMNSDFQIEEKNIIQTVTIDHLIGDVDLKNKKLIIKIDVEGNDLNVLAGAQDTINKFSPFIIIEFSSFIMKNKEFNYNFLREFLKKNNYQIYDTAGNISEVSDIIKLIENLDKVHNTIGNYYLIEKNNLEYKDILFYNKNE